MGKKRIIKKYEQLSKEMLELLRSEYPEGFEDNFITFESPKGEIELALPLETDEAYYMIKMPKENLPEDEEDSSDVGTTEASGEEFESLENLEIAEDVADED